MATAVLYNLQPNLALANGTIETYEADGTTPQATYKDNQQASVHDTTIQLDTYGLPPGGSMWLGSNLTYKLIFKDYTGTVIYAVNNVEPGGNTFTAGIQLGGNLDVNGNLITSNPINPDISITPYGVGQVEIQNLSLSSNGSIGGYTLSGTGSLHIPGASFLLLPTTVYNSTNTTESIAGLNSLLKPSYYHDIEITIQWSSSSSGSHMGFSLDFLSSDGTSVANGVHVRDIYDGSSWSRDIESASVTTVPIIDKTSGGTGTTTGTCTLILHHRSANCSLTGTGIQYRDAGSSVTTYIIQDYIVNINPRLIASSAVAFDGIKITKVMDTTPNANDRFQVTIKATPVDTV